MDNKEYCGSFFDCLCEWLDKKTEQKWTIFKLMTYLDCQTTEIINDENKIDLDIMKKICKKFNIHLVIYDLESLQPFKKGKIILDIHVRPHFDKTISRYGSNYFPKNLHMTYDKNLNNFYLMTLKSKYDDITNTVNSVIDFVFDDKN